MKKLLFITFICSSLCAYAQSEIPEDTIKNRPPVKKEQIPFSPKENKRTGLDESQPQQSLQGEQQEEINLHLPPSDYVEPLPWTDMKKIHFQKNIFEWDFQRFADFLYNPQNEMFRLLGTKRSFSQNETFFFSHPYPPLPCPFPLNFSLLIITKKFGNLAKNRYICIV